MTEPAEKTESGDALHYRPRGRIIPAEEIEAWQTGQSYMDAAAREAERLREEALLAFEEAKKDGFEEGRKEGAAAAASLLAETALRADRHLAAADQQIVDLALAVVRRVLGEFDVGQLTQNAALHALSRQRQSQHLTLHVAPDMVDGLRADLDAGFEAGTRHLITVEPDPRLDRGQCRLASEIGFVDLGIEAQLNAIHRGLSEGLERQARG
ncbi:MAG: type III secretion system stator protein SctL [Alphaproteobacteria bacterium]|nr:type III secretion system stator protein SctL [Alphaproteobacteria bacterium]